MRKRKKKPRPLWLGDVFILALVIALALFLLITGPLESLFDAWSAYRRRQRLKYWRKHRQALYIAEGLVDVDNRRG